MKRLKKLWIMAVVMVVICMLPVAAMANEEILIDPLFTPDNFNNKLSAGTATWDNVSKTLTLNNAKLNGYILVYESCTIKLVGTNTITPSGALSGVQIGDSYFGEPIEVAFSGNGTLTITSEVAAIRSESDVGSLIFRSGTVNAITTGSSEPAVDTKEGITIDTGAALKAKSNANVAVRDHSSIEINGTLIASTTAPDGVAIEAFNNNVTINGQPADPDILASSSVEINKPAHIPAHIPAVSVSTPKTGDNTPIMLLASLMLTSAAVLFMNKKRAA